jgi:hypothetical protein
MNTIGKILLRTFLTIAGTAIMSLFVVSLADYFNNPELKNQSALTGFFDPL